MPSCDQLAAATVFRGTQLSITYALCSNMTFRIMHQTRLCSVPVN